MRENTNGTFFSSNLNSIAYNYASIDGSREYSNMIGDYDVKRTEACSEHSTATVEEFQKNQALLQSYVNSYESTTASISKLKACVDVDTMEKRFADVCCNLPGYAPCDETPLNGSLCPKNSYSGAPYKPISQYMNTEVCQLNANAWTLSNVAKFDCDKLPLCVTTCKGPKMALVKAVTKHCACTSESFLHANLLRVSIAFCIYLLTNVSRLILVSAACKLLWRQLTPGLIDCVFTSTIDAVLLLQTKATTPEDLAANPMRMGKVKVGVNSRLDNEEPLTKLEPSTASKYELRYSAGVSPAVMHNSSDHIGLSENYKEIVRQRIQRDLTNWERGAWCELFLSLIVNAPWIALLFIMNDDEIRYTPTSE